MNVKEKVRKIFQFPINKKGRYPLLGCKSFTIDDNKQMEGDLNWILKKRNGDQKILVKGKTRWDRDEYITLE